MKKPMKLWSSATLAVTGYMKCLYVEKIWTAKVISVPPCWFLLFTDRVKKPFVVDPKRSHEHQLSLVPKPSFIFHL